MAEAIALTASLLTLAATASAICHTLQQGLTALEEMPRTLRFISSDLEDYYKVLGTLQALLGDDETATGVVQPVTSVNIQSVLNNAVGIFKESSVLVHQLDEEGRSAGLSAWQRFKWIFRWREILELREMLIGNKITLSVAISIANWLAFLYQFR